MASKTNKIWPVRHTRLPKLYERTSGPYYAPDGKLYVGFGENLFHSAITGEPMPKEYYPMTKPWDSPEIFKKPPKQSNATLPEPGEEAFGEYVTPDRMCYRGVGRVLKVHVRLNDRGRIGYAIIYVEPIPGMHGDEYQFFEPCFQRPMEEMNMPSAPYPLDDPQTLKGGTKKDKHRGYSSSPTLGTEEFGSYIAPNGQWYCGVGRVIKTGLNIKRQVYTYVEPIPGKQGGDYDFFHLSTRDWMPQDQLPSNPRNDLAPEVKEDAKLVAPGKLYLGFGTVTEVGTDEKGHIYVYMERSFGTRRIAAPGEGHVYLNVEPPESDIGGPDCIGVELPERDYSDTESNY